MSQNSEPIGVFIQQAPVSRVIAGCATADHTRFLPAMSCFSYDNWCDYACACDYPTYDSWHACGSQEVACPDGTLVCQYSTETGPVEDLPACEGHGNSPVGAIIGALAAVLVLGVSIFALHMKRMLCFKRKGQAGTVSKVQVAPAPVVMAAAVPYAATLPAATSVSAPETNGSLRATLTALTMPQLRERAAKAGCDQAAIEDARDGDDPKTELIELILQQAKSQAPLDANALRAELAALRVPELRGRAAAEGVSDTAIEDARDGDDPKTELIELIVAKAAGP
jgi:hypothetical protein